MNKALRISLLILGFITLLNVQHASAQNWPQWRGPHGTGIVPSGNPPIEWSEETNIRWKTLLPGTGQSTPAVWGDTIFVTAALSPEPDTGTGGIVKATKPVKFLVVSLDRETGRIKWERVAREEIPHQTRNDMGTWATASPITDGKHVFAFFGSRGLYCYTLEGKLVWEKDFGDMDTGGDMGEGSSPALYKDRLIVNWDHYGEDFIAALEPSTGKEIWRKKRDERISWTTPIFVEEAGRVQVITVAENWILSYDLANGDVLWKSAGTRYGNISTPVAAGGILYVGSGLREGQVQAIRLEGAEGDISGSPSILWSFDKFLPYVSSPLFYDGFLYFLKDKHGFLTCLDAATGEPHYANKRISGIRYVFASPVGVSDRIYILGRDGGAVVIEKGPEFKVLATNTLDDKFDASPVIVGDEILLRGHRSLYCIAR
jgi:outer membrane protein assembly factor BamB